MSIDLTTGCTRDERGHNFNCHKICQWCNRPKDEIELEKLRGLLRWRKWPEEKPETGGKYLVIWFDDLNGLWLEDIKVVQCNEPLRECYLKLGYFYWRPIGPLPGGE
jgi:hypothetical protein